jgi:spore coat polysaccharide biosynthesis predicted glycosyltransferase SpsG
MGLPSLICVLADNQRDIARQLAAAGAIRVWASRPELKEQLDQYVSDSALYRSAIDAAAGICDGRGLERVVSVMQSC